MLGCQSHRSETICDGGQEWLKRVLLPEPLLSLILALLLGENVTKADT